MKYPKLLTAVTVDESLVLFETQLEYLHQNGYEVHLSCSSTKSKLDNVSDCVIFHNIPMERNPSPIFDLLSLIKIMKLILKVSPDIVNASTPKAGFLFILSSWLLRVPKRIYYIRGLRHQSMSGKSVVLQKIIERLCCFFSTHVICLSQSVKSQLLADVKVDPNKLNILGRGGSGSILDRFKKMPRNLALEKTSMSELGNSFIFGFVGRLVERKGINELIDAFTNINSKYPETKLVLVGPFDKTQPLSLGCLKEIEKHPNIIHIGQVSNSTTYIYYSLFDLFVFPAYWEGFGNVLIEAASCGVPILAADVTGVKDAVSHDFNGYLLDSVDVNKLEVEMEALLNDPQRLDFYAKNGPRWSENFSRQRVNDDLLHFYESL